MSPTLEQTDTYITKKIEVDSEFIKLYKNKIDNLFLYQNGLIENFATDKDMINFLNDPKEKSKEKIVVKDSFIKEFNDHIGKISLFELKIITIYNRENETGFKFFLKENTTELTLRKNKMYVPTKNLIVRKDPGKDKIELKSIEQIFSKSNLNVIDFSKTLVDSGFYKNSLKKQIVEPTSDKEKINKSESLKKYNNLDFAKTLQSLEANLYTTEVSNSSGRGIKRKIKDVFFSKTIGFSIKSLTISDINDFKTIGSEIIKKETIDLSANKKKIALLDAFGWYGAAKTKEVYKIKNIDTTEVENKIYTLSYFSPFKSKGTDTGLKTIYSTECDIEITQSTSDPLQSNVKKISSILSRKEDVTPMNINDLKNNLKLKHRLSKEQFEDKHKKISQNLEKNSTAVNFITDIQVDNGYIKVVAEFTLISTLEDIVFNSSLFEDAHIFIPKICLETINGPIGLLNVDTTLSNYSPITRKAALEAAKDNSIIVDKKISREISEDEIVGTLCKLVYRIKISEVFKQVQIKNASRLRSLGSLYGFKYFFTDGKKYKSYSTQDIVSFENSNIKTEYPIFAPDFALSGLSVDEQKRSDIVENFNSNNTDDVNQESDSSNESFDDDQQDVPEVDDSLKNDPESVLKVSEKSSRKSRRKPVNKRNVKNSKSLDNIKTAKAAKKKINEEDLIVDYFALNNITQENQKGVKNNLKEYSNLKYYSRTWFFNPFQSRRGNVQPKLLKLIDMAVELTKREHSSLLKAHIASTSTMPADLWVKVVGAADIWSKNGFVNKRLTEELNKIGFTYVKENIAKRELNKLLRRGGSGPDSNHSLGFAADVFLERQHSDGSKKFICLFDPHDDDDFVIAKRFIEICFDLGASNIGSGRFYMDYPSYTTYKAKKTHVKYKYLPEHKGKIITVNDIPLREEGKNHPRRSGIHIDIVRQNPTLGRVNTEMGPNNRYTIAQYLANYKKILSKKKVYTEMFKGEVFNKRATYIEKNIKYKTKQGKGVWGEDRSRKSAEYWLLEIINAGKTAEGKYKDSKDITVANTKNIGLDLFEIGEKEMLDKIKSRIRHGNSTDEIKGYVKESDLLKDKKEEVKE